MTWRASAALAAALALWPGPLSSHPHFFIYYGIELRIGAHRDPGIRVAWKLNELLSQHVLTTFDLDRDGMLSPGEVRQIEVRYFRPQYGPAYFAKIGLNGTPIPVKNVEAFEVSLDRRRVTFHFTIPLRPWRAPPGTVDIAFDDASLLIAFLPAGPESVRAVAAPPYTGECRLTRDSQTLFPAAVQCSYARAGK